MFNQSVTNILTEDLLLAFAKALSTSSRMKIMCVGNHDPLSRKSCEMIEAAHAAVHKFQFIKQSNPVVIVPIQRKKFTCMISWESSICGLSNHRLVDYVINVERCSIIDIVDRVKPDFIFINRSVPEASQLENFAKKLRIKLIRV